MKQVVFDFETYYDKEYSLRKMTPVEYILDARYETIGCAIKEDGGKTFWLEENDLKSYLSRLPPKVLAISHNALFDMCILAFRFNYVPFLMADTLGMSRAWLGHKLRRHGLAYLAAHLGIGVKGNTVQKVIGMRLADIKRVPGLYEAYVEYSKGDSDLCWAAFDFFIKDGFPLKELVVMDIVLRACVKPEFSLDKTKLAMHLHKVQLQKAELLRSTGMENRDALMSNEKFAAALEALGVDVPMKTSLTTGKQTYAFAKTDPAFLDLEEHEDERVQTLVTARLGVKSTLEETRTARFIRIANLTWPSNLYPLHAGYPLLPMPLRFSGAHTHRFSGDWNLNVQNLPTRKDNTIRTAIIALPGRKVVVVDASQIEARLVAWFCGQWDLVDGFARKEDIYSMFATMIFGRLITKADKPERFVGKQAILGLGYNLGWVKFQKKVALDSKDQTGQEIVLDDAEAGRVVSLYRNTYSAVPAMWRILTGLIQQMTNRDCDITLGPLRFLHEKILLPNGLYLYFHNLRYEDNGWLFEYGGKIKYLYGGKLLENICQALARIIIMDCAVRVKARTGYDMKLQVHDELVYIALEGVAEWLRDVIIEEMRKPPSWGLDIPLDAEGDVAQSYGDAK